MTFARWAPEWELVGGDPTPGDPCAYDSLAGFFAATAENAQQAGGRLRRLVDNADESIWRGTSADVFREDLGKLPGRLDKLWHSYDEAAQALRTYGVSLRQLQAKSDYELHKAVAADAEAAAAVERLTAADMPCGPTGPVMGPAPGPTIGPALGDPTEEARARLAQAREAIEQIRQERENAETTAVSKLDHAGEMGMHNKSRWDRITGAIGGALEAVDSLVHKGLRAIGDLADWLAPYITAIGMVLVVATIVAAVVASGGVALPAVLSATSLWAASGTVFTAAAVTSAVGVGAKIASKRIYNDADLSWGSLGLDAGLAAVSLAGGSMQSLQKGSTFLRGTRLFQSGAQTFSTLTTSGTRVGTFALRSSQIGSQAWARAGAISTTAGTAWRSLVGTQGAPTMFGMVFKLGDEARGLWAGQVGSPIRFIPGIGLGSETVTNVSMAGATR
jgi:uncharacterized protein YukE